MPYSKYKLTGKGVAYMNINTNDLFLNSNKKEEADTGLFCDASFLATKKTSEVAGAENTEKVSKAALYSESTNTRDADYNYNEELFAGSDNMNSKSSVKSMNIEQQLMNDIEQLSDSVTPEGFDKAKELGITPDDDVEDFVSVYDRIQIELATYCDNYKVTGDRIDSGKIEAVYGEGNISANIKKTLSSYNLPDNDENVNSVLKAFNMAKESGQITKGMTSYLAKNGMKPTIQNIYTAAFSGSTERSEVQSLGLTDSEWENVKTQAESIIEKAGLEVEENTLNTARWMLEEGIPLTADNMLNVNNILKASGSISEAGVMSDVNIIDSIVHAMSYGIRATDASLNPDSLNLSRVDSAIEVINNATDENIATIVAEDKTVNIYNLKKQQEDETKTNSTKETVNKQLDFSDIKYIQAKRAVIELTVMMTKQSGAKMLKLGISIETEALTVMADELRDMENDYYSSFFSAVSKKGYTPSIADNDFLKTTMQAMEQLKSTPNLISGMVSAGKVEFTVESVSIVGAGLKSRLDIASISYETLGTEVRSDLGDSIKKAFSNIDSVLQLAGVEVNDATRKAAKILAYNSMEITQESISSVENINEDFDKLIQKMTPKTTAYLISNGIDPLNTNISDLNTELDKINEEIEPDYNEKFSTFLWKLQNQKDIPEDERDAYVGIYRLFNMIQKNDSSVLGAALSTMQNNYSESITLRDIANELKTKKASGLDVNIDDDFGLLTNLVTDEKSLDKQLLAFDKFKSISDIRYSEDMLNEDSETFAENLRNISEDAINLVLESGNRTSVNNIVIAQYMTTSGGNIFKEALNVVADEKKDKVKKAMDNIADSMDSSEDIEEALNTLNSTITDSADYKTEVKLLRQMNKVITFMANASNNNSYQIPIEMDGEYTQIHLTIKESSEKSGNVSAVIQTEELGNVRSEFTLTPNGMSGIIITNNSNAVDKLNKAADMMQEMLRDTENLSVNIGNSSIQVAVSESINANMWKNSTDASGNVENKTLFYIAKTFVRAISRTSNTNNQI